jgi:[glutamine synthetase] adenylyltransferase / [glutamine synthetase]-adenylyl-L-tyrosine phosphorylase
MPEGAAPRRSSVIHRPPESHRVTENDGKEHLAAISRLPGPLQDSLQRWVERLREHRPRAFDDLQPTDRRKLLRLAACSEFAGNVAIREWDWLVRQLRDGTLRDGADPAASRPAEWPEDIGEFKQALRRRRNRSLIRILWRDLNEQASVADTLAALSTLADMLIAAAVAFAEADMRWRFGTVQDGAGRELAIVLLAMGKLGGRELNFSSDIDLIFLYPADGESAGARSLAAQEYFTRLSRLIVMLLEEVTPDGFVYRVDTRLRPFGDSGPPVVSFGALESYLLRHGRGWERYAYVKARVLDTGHPAVAADLMRNIIEPFVYRRYLDYGVFESLRDMKALVAAEAKRRQLADDIKRGPGGIREIEFIVQSLQLVRGGGDRKLRTPELQVALKRLERTKNLEARDAAALDESYRFLRRLENVIQAIRDQQVHALPGSQPDQARLALAMDCSNWAALAEEIGRRREAVTGLFESVAFRGGEKRLQTDIGGSAATLWNASSGMEEWADMFRNFGYGEADAMAKVIAGFASGGPVAQTDRTGAKRLARFVPALLVTLQGREQPSVVLKRVLGIVEQVLRRSAYIALLNENPMVLERLVGLCEASAWLAAEVGRFPLLLDELLDPRLYTMELSPEEMRTDLKRRLDGIAGGDSEQQIETLGQFQRATLFRVAVADVTDNLPVMKVSDRLTELAELVVNTALAVAWRDLTQRHGLPYVETAGGRRRAGFGVIAYGKFGGIELSYGSDLDLVFLHDGNGPVQVTDGAKPLDNSVFFARLVRRLVHFLTAQTSSGALYQVDTRLRPSGRSGLLVTSVDAFARYQEENAWTWEHQALLRSRPVAGSAAVAREFQRIRGETLRRRVRRDRLAEDVRNMRARMRRQLSRDDQAHFDLKQGAGGIGDIEFLVQYLVLNHAGEHPALIYYPDNIRQLGVLEATGCLEGDDVRRLQDVYRSYRLCLHRLVLDDQPPLVAEDRFADERRDVIALWDRLLGESA